VASGNKYQFQWPKTGGARPTHREEKHKIKTEIRVKNALRNITGVNIDRRFSAHANRSA